MRLHDSKLEEKFAGDIARFRLPEPEYQYRFAKDAFGRQWRFDVSWPFYKLAVEIDGYLANQHGVITGGHGLIMAVRSANNKGNAAILLGWHVLHFEQSALKNGDAIAMTQRALVCKGWQPP